MCKQSQQPRIPKADRPIINALADITLSECSDAMPEDDARSTSKAIAVAILDDIRRQARKASEAFEIVCREPSADEMRDRLLEEALAG